MKCNQAVNSGLTLQLQMCHWSPSARAVKPPGVASVTQLKVYSAPPMKLVEFPFVTDSNNAANDASNGPSNDHASRKKGERKQLPWYIEIPVVVIATMVILGLLQTFVGRLYVIPSASMEPTLHGCTGCTGDRIYVNKLAYRFGSPEPGDVVVFAGTESWNANYESKRSSNPIIRGMQNVGSSIGIVPPDQNDLVKRIIATGGQTVECQAGDAGVKVDGKVVDSSYILSPPAYPVDSATGSTECGGPYFGPVQVPDGNVFVMGDNHTNSADPNHIKPILS